MPSFRWQSLLIYHKNKRLNINENHRNQEFTDILFYPRQQAD
jgi:hypothetical protein